MNVYDGIECPPLPISNKMVAIVASRPLTREKQLKVDGLDYMRSEAHRYDKNDMTAVTEQFVAQAPKGQVECVKDAHG